MKVLRARVYEHQRQHDAASRAEQRSVTILNVNSNTLIIIIVQAAVGGGARSERMRTYNWAQDRVTDHRSGDSTSTRILTNGVKRKKIFEIYPSFVELPIQCYFFFFDDVCNIGVVR